MVLPIPTVFRKVIFLNEQREPPPSVTIYVNPGSPYCHPNLMKSLSLYLNIVFKWPNPVLQVSKLQRRHSEDLESAQDGGDAFLQVVPSLVAFVDHLL